MAVRGTQPTTLGSTNSVMRRSVTVLLGLLLAALKELPAQETLPVTTGDRVRVNAPSIQRSWIAGVVLSLDADTLVLKEQRSPWFSKKWMIPLTAIMKCDVKVPSTGRWQAVPQLEKRPEMLKAERVALERAWMNGDRGPLAHRTASDNVRIAEVSVYGGSVATDTVGEFSASGR